MRKLVYKAVFCASYFYLISTKMTKFLTKRLIVIIDILKQYFALKNYVTRTQGHHWVKSI